MSIENDVSPDATVAVSADIGQSKLCYAIFDYKLVVVSCTKKNLAVSLSYKTCGISLTAPDPIYNDLRVWLISKTTLTYQAAEGRLHRSVA
jgi:hypothetical protein